jgi:drug/metabolite transporter (DMT)-like permease
VFALLIGEVFYITGISSSNVTTVSYTALAYPVVALLFDSVRGRAIMTTQDIIGFAFVSIGFLVLASRNSNL